MTRTSTFRSLIALFFLFSSVFSASLAAQQPFFTCSSTTVIHNDSTTNDPLLWNGSYWWDTVIQSHDMAEGAAPFTIQVTDSCTTTQYGFILRLDLDNNGSLETYVHSDSLPAAGTIQYNNASTNAQGGTSRDFDFRSVLPADKYQFEIGVDSIAPFVRQLRLLWRSGNTVIPVQLPYGMHSVQWLATNGCGAQATCSFLGYVQDSQMPTISCINGLSVNLMNVQGGLITLWASDFINMVMDNYTPSSLIRIAIRHVGQPDGMGNTTGFPRNANGTPQTGLTFNCGHLGTQLVELWALDQYNLTNLCETYVLIQDNMSNCSSSPEYSGRVATEFLVGIPDVEIFVEGTSNGIPSFGTTVAITNGDGVFNLATAQALPGMFKITPVLDIDPLNGVNTWDLVLISRHILGLEPLNTPYKLIAADANKSGTVTTFDIVELRKLILGSYQHLPYNNSWRFIDKAQVFTNPQNPFADVIRESITLTYSSVSAPDFIGAKIGDVDYTASPNFGETTLEERFEKTAHISTKDQYLAENETVVLPIDLTHSLEGYQFTLDLGALELLEILPENGLTLDHFAIHSTAAGTSVAVVSELAAHRFSLRVRARRAGHISEWLQLSNGAVRSMGFDREGIPHGLALQVQPDEQQAVLLAQNSPNPWSASTQIGFYLPTEGTVVLRVLDAMGRVVTTHRADYPAGYHAHTVDATTIATPGVFTYTLEVNGVFLAKKMLKK